MAKRRKAFVHVGMSGVGDMVEAALVHHRDALVELGVTVPAKSSQESFRAAVELLREHKAWGFSRGEVEGQWAKICRRAQKGRSTVVFSQPLLAAASTDQAALLLDGLADFEVHVVVTATGPHPWATPGEPETDLGTVLERWRAVVRKPERVHVVLVEARPGFPGETAKAAWKGFGKAVGFGTASLGLDAVHPPVAARSLSLVPDVPAERAGVLGAIARSWAEQLRSGGFSVHGDVDAVLGAPPAVAEPVQRLGRLDQALHDALREIDRLTRRNESLEARLAETEKKRKKLKKKLEVA